MEPKMDVWMCRAAAGSECLQSVLHCRSIPIKLSFFFFFFCINSRWNRSPHLPCKLILRHASFSRWEGCVINCAFAKFIPERRKKVWFWSEARRRRRLLIPCWKNLHHYSSKKCTIQKCVITIKSIAVNIKIKLLAPKNKYKFPPGEMRDGEI